MGGHPCHGSKNGCLTHTITYTTVSQRLVEKFHLPLIFSHSIPFSKFRTLFTIHLINLTARNSSKSSNPCLFLTLTRITISDCLHSAPREPPTHFTKKILFYLTQPLRNNLLSNFKQLSHLTSGYSSKNTPNL